MKFKVVMGFLMLVFLMVFCLVDFDSLGLEYMLDMYCLVVIELYVDYGELCGCIYEDVKMCFLVKVLLKYVIFYVGMDLVIVMMMLLYNCKLGVVFVFIYGLFVWDLDYNIDVNY